MEIRTRPYCNKCGKKIDGQYAEGKQWDIWFPSQTAGGSAGTSLDGYCWDCYGKVCDKLNRIYEYEIKHGVDFDVNIKVKFTKK